MMDEYMQSSVKTPANPVASPTKPAATNPHCQ